MLLAALFSILPFVLSAPLSPRCKNHLMNPSFESGLSSYLVIVSSAWGERGPLAASGHASSTSYHAYSPSTISSSLTIGQSGVDVPAGTTVECAAWVKSRRSVGTTRVEVFLDGVSCGVEFLRGTEGWVRVGGAVKVMGGGEGGTFAVVLGSEAAGEDGWEVWVDDLVVGEGC